MAKWREHVTLSAQRFQSEGLTAPRRVFPPHGQHLPPTAVGQTTPNLVAQNHTSWSSDAQRDGILCLGLSLSRGLGENIFQVHSGGGQNAILHSFTTEEPVPLLAVSPGLPACPVNPSPSSSSPCFQSLTSTRHQSEKPFHFSELMWFHSITPTRSGSHRFWALSGTSLGATWEFCFPGRLTFASCPSTPKPRDTNLPLTARSASLASHHKAKKASLDVQTLRWTDWDGISGSSLLSTEVTLRTQMLSYERLWFIYLTQLYSILKMSYNKGETSSVSALINTGWVLTKGCTKNGLHNSN